MVSPSLPLWGIIDISSFTPEDFMSVLLFSVKFWYSRGSSPKTFPPFVFWYPLVHQVVNLNLFYFLRTILGIILYDQGGFPYFADDLLFFECTGKPWILDQSFVFRRTQFLAVAYLMTTRAALRAYFFLV